MEKLLMVATRQASADVLLQGAKVVNVFTGEVRETQVALVGERIAGVGDYFEGQEVVDLSGYYLLPGFIDAYFHLESAMLTPPSFVQAALPHGTTTVISTPESIVKASGFTGLEYLFKAGQDLPMDLFYLVPDDYPAVYQEASAALPAGPSSQAVQAKLGGYSGSDENYFSALAAAGVRLDHTSTYPREAEEKLALGIRTLICEGSTAKNLDALLNIVDPTTARFCAFCTGDRLPQDLLEEGQIEHILRYAVAWGLDPLTAVRMATLNPARFYGLHDRGAIAPGYLADLVVVDSLYAYRVHEVYKRGIRVVAQGKTCVSMHKKNRVAQLCPGLLQTLDLPDLHAKLDYSPPVGRERAQVMEVLADQLNTRSGWIAPGATEPEYEVMKVAVIGRQQKSENVGLGFVRGFGLKAGALASTVTYPDHDLIVVGADRSAMLLAAETVAQMGGGLAVVSGNKVLATLPLPVAGLLSEESVEKLALDHAKVNAAAQGLGCTIYAPFRTMAFLTDPRIPALKLTSQGLISAPGNKTVDLWV